MIATVAAVAGCGLLVAGVYGLANVWWASVLAGVLLVAFAVLDERGRLQEQHDTPARRRGGAG